MIHDVSEVLKKEVNIINDAKCPEATLWWTNVTMENHHF